MVFFVVSFFAGALTVLAPCILPLLPVVVGSSLSRRSRLTPYVVILSLSGSIIVFTFVLKVSTAFITIPQTFWNSLSGGILVLFGVTLLFPTVWERIPLIAGLSVSSNKLLGTGHLKKSFWGDVLVGASLGPIFSTCSPTYFVILASVLPASFLLGTIYLLAYTLGLGLVLLCIALLGERLTSKLSWASDSRGIFKRSLGVIFILLGIAIINGLDKKFETFILEKGFFDITKIEYQLLEQTVIPENTIPDKPPTPEVNSSNNSTTTTQEMKPQEPQESQNALSLPTTKKNMYREIVSPSGYINTNNEDITIGQYVGEKVILLNVMTYSCINCQRTFPYVNAWYEKYRDDGLLVIGIHTPEFAFEKNKTNVENAMREFGITYPVVMDNDFATWKAYGNKYWPRKYLIDSNGNIIFDHIGEGKYVETELAIVQALQELKQQQNTKDLSE